MELFGADRRVLALSVARMADAVGNSFLVIVLPLFIASGRVSGPLLGARILGVTVTEPLIIGVVLSLLGFLNSFAQPFAGRLSDRTGRRKVYILFGLAVLFVTDLAYVFADRYWLLILIRAVQGIGVAFTIPATLALVNELATTATRGGNMGVFNTFRLLGFGAGPVAAGAIVNAGPYRLFDVPVSGFEAAFAMAALTAAVGYAMVTVMVEDPEETRASAGRDLSIAIRDESGEHLLDPVFTLGLATLVMAIGIALISTLQNVINARLDQTATVFGLQFASFVLVQVALQAPVGRATDLYGRRPFVVAGMILLVPTTLWQGLVTSSVELLLARIAQGVAMTMVFAPSLAIAGDLAGKGESGTKLAVLTMAFGLGVAIGPLLSGALVGFGFVVPFAVGAALAAVGAVLVYTQVEETVKPGGSTPAD
ncbi:MAG: MFS transporter [Halobacteriales archaeon]|nr:MFS transporter [Halobacteriales archaeon]